MLIDGNWTSDWHPVQAKDKDGRFLRQTSEFRNWVTPDGNAGPTGEAGFKAEAGRYHLYVALICPWASRTLIARKLKGLEDVVGVSIVNPRLSDQGWTFQSFDGADADPLFDATYMHEIYTRADPKYSGRATVPVLWDKKQNRLVNNESADILKMLNAGFGDLARSDLDLYPDDLAHEIDALNPWLYDQLNNGVYKSGFASSQEAYDEAVSGVFDALDTLETRLSDGRAYLFGEQLTESDIRLFVTTIRFDAAYHGLFKTNWKRIADYPHLQTHLERMLNIPGIRDTVNIDHILAGYYSIKALNPGQITPGAPSHIAKLLAQ